jgi:hypothetical protein
MSRNVTAALSVVCWMLLIVALLLLSGCATDQAVARVDTVTVDKPVPVPCVDSKDIPPTPQPAIARVGASLDQKTAALGSELLQRREYDARAAALLAACSSLPPQPKGNP